MRKISGQWGFTPGERRALLFICSAFLIGWGYRLHKTHTQTDPVPLNHQDSLAISAINSVYCNVQKGPDSLRSEQAGIQTNLLCTDINLATRIEFERLPGIGPVIAGRIIAERDRRGGFLEVTDLLDIKGIGDKKLEAIREMIECRTYQE